MPACATADFNGADQRGAGFFQTTTHRRRRWSAADAYLRPALSRPNLTVRTGVLGERVLIEHGRARGALSRPDAAGADTEVGTTDALAANEVIVCAGSICSPHVLLRSGIGRRATYEPGLPVVVDLPGVGANLQDHPTLLPVIWTTRSDRDLRPGAAAPQAQADWLERGSGPVSSNIGEAGAFFSTRRQPRPTSRCMRHHCPSTTASTPRRPPPSPSY